MYVLSPSSADSGSPGSPLAQQTLPPQSLPSQDPHTIDSVDDVLQDLIKSVESESDNPHQPYEHWMIDDLCQTWGIESDNLPQQQDPLFPNMDQEKQRVPNECNSDSEPIAAENQRKQYKKRSRITFSPYQILELEKEFTRCRYRDRLANAMIAVRLNLSEKQIRNWFTNRRLKYKNEMSARTNNINHNHNNSNASIALDISMSSPANSASLQRNGFPIEQVQQPQQPIVPWSMQHQEQIPPNFSLPSPIIYPVSDQNKNRP